MQMSFLPDLERSSMVSSHMIYITRRYPAEVLIFIVFARDHDKNQDLGMILPEK